MFRFLPGPPSFWIVEDDLRILSCLVHLSEIGYIRFNAQGFIILIVCVSQIRLDFVFFIRHTLSLRANASESSWNLRNFEIPGRWASANMITIDGSDSDLRQEAHCSPSEGNHKKEKQWCLLPLPRWCASVARFAKSTLLGDSNGRLAPFQSSERCQQDSQAGQNPRIEIKWNWENVQKMYKNQNHQKGASNEDRHVKDDHPWIKAGYEPTPFCSQT